MKPKVIIFDSAKDLAEHASEMLLEEMQRKKKLVLGLPTGRTVVPFYKELIRMHKKDKTDFSKLKIFNLDEYIGVKPEQKRSFKYFMDNQLFKKIDIKDKNLHILSGTAVNTKKEAERYEKKIKQSGGLDLVFLGIGVNGHIAFNEPGSPFNSRTRKVALSYETRKSNFGMFHSVFKAPTHAITVGIANILGAKKIILMATGKHKAKAVKKMLNGEMTTDCPASALRKHPDVTILLDKKAASTLKEKPKKKD